MKPYLSQPPQIIILFCTKAPDAPYKYFGRSSYISELSFVSSESNSNNSVSLVALTPEEYNPFPVEIMNANGCFAKKLNKLW